jgi:hypothetical protein
VIVVYVGVGNVVMKQEHPLLSWYGLNDDRYGGMKRDRGPISRFTGDGYSSVVYVLNTSTVTVSTLLLLV